MSGYYIARHGQSEWNLAHRIQGQTNTPLSPLGMQQGRDLFQALKDKTLTEIFTSNLDRSFRTAQSLARYQGLPSRRIVRQNELAFGELEGKYLNDLDKQDQELWEWWMADPVQRRIPGGESYQDLFDRIGPFMEELEKTTDQASILIVGHLRVNQVLMSYLADLPLKKATAICQPNHWIYYYRKGAQIWGAEIPSQADGKLNWQPGLLYQ